MRSRRRTPFAFLALSLLLAAPASAAKPAPTIGPPPLLEPSSQALPPACALGVPGPPANAFGYIIPPNDRYFTLLGPCTACGGGGQLSLSTAHVQLSFTQSCSIPVYVSIVGADLSVPGCPVPNPADVLCAEVLYTLSDGGVLNQCQDFAMDLSSGCCINGPAFLQIRFDSGSCPDQQPLFCGPPSCQNCQQYNIYPGSSPGGDDLCMVLSPSGVYGAVMYADADCGCTTPVAPRTWGNVKMLYR